MAVDRHAHNVNKIIREQLMDDGDSEEDESQAETELSSLSAGNHDLVRCHIIWVLRVT